MGIINDSQLVNKRYVIFCPICNKEIPDLSFVLKNNTMILHLYCKNNNRQLKCKFDDFINEIRALPLQDALCSLHVDKKGGMFCVSCDEWTCSICANRHRKYHHLLFDFEYHLVCHQHKKDYEFYNKYTQEQCCLQCTRASNKDANYTRIAPVDIDTLEKEFKIIYEIVSRLKERSSQMIEMLNEDKRRFLKQRYYLEWTNALIQSDSDLDAIFHAFTVFVPLLINTVIEIRPHYSYQLMKLSQKIQIRDEDIDLDPNRIENSFVLTQNILKRSLRLNKPKKREIKAKGIDSDISCCIGTIAIQRNVCFMGVYRNNQIITCLIGGVVKIWDIDTLQCNTLINLNKEIKYIGLFDNIKRIFTLNDSELSLRDLITFMRIKTVTVGLVGSCIQLKGGKMTTAASSDSNFPIKLWSFRDLSHTDLIGHIGQITCLIELKSGFLLSSSEDLTLKVWNTVFHQCLTSISISKMSMINVFELNNGGIALFKNEQSIKIIHKHLFNVVNKLQSKAKKSIFNIISLSKGKYASYQLDNSTIQIWDDDSFKSHYSIKHSSGKIQHLCALDENHLIMCSLGGILKIWYHD